MSDELERRIEILENDVEVLTAALRSALDWSIGDRQGRHFQTPAADLIVSGQKATREILDQLPG